MVPADKAGSKANRKRQAADHSVGLLSFKSRYVISTSTTASRHNQTHAPQQNKAGINAAGCAFANRQLVGITTSDTSAEATSVLERRSDLMFVMVLVVLVLVALGTIESLFRCDKTKTRPAKS
jgi:septal ring-binding cell division protein DamX